jgi:hypothetical protein
LTDSAEELENKTLLSAAMGRFVISMVLRIAPNAPRMLREPLPRQKLYFMYLGRRGPLGRFALELAQACRDHPEIDATFVISRRNRVADDIGRCGSSILELETFASAASMSVARNFFRRGVSSWIHSIAMPRQLSSH